MIRTFGRKAPGTDHVDRAIAVLCWLAVFALISAVIADSFR
jgi:hypothetical protein